MSLWKRIIKKQSKEQLEEDGLRYCINSAGLRFIPLDKMKEEGYEEYISLVEGA